MSLSLFAAAQECPERVALMEGASSWTFAELARDVRSEIARLRSRGIALPGAPRVARVDAQLDSRSVVTILALIEQGVPFVPVHPQLGESEERALTDPVAPLFDASAGPRAGAACCPGAISRVNDDARPLAYLATSGSSGPPHLAELSRAAFAAAALASAEHLGWADEERWMACLPLAHVGGLSILTRCLHGRGCVALAPARGPLELAESFARHEPTLVSMVPAMIDRLLAADPAWRSPRSTRAILIGGAAAPASLVHRALERGLPILLTYGMTETCAQVATARPGADPRRLVPLPGVRLREGDEGLEVQTPSLATRLLPRQADAEAWCADGWLRTADLGRVEPDGSLTVLGRSDDVIVSGGEKIVPGEVENALRACAGIADALVFGVPDERWGAIVAAALVRSEGMHANDARVRDCVGERLARFKHPRRVAWLEELPLTALGKVDRRAAIQRARPLLRAL